MPSSLLRRRLGQRLRRGAGLQPQRGAPFPIFVVTRKSTKIVLFCSLQFPLFQRERTSVLGARGTFAEVNECVKSGNHQIVCVVSDAPTERYPC